VQKKTEQELNEALDHIFAANVFEKLGERLALFPPSFSDQASFYGRTPRGGGGVGPAGGGYPRPSPWWVPAGPPQVLKRSLSRTDGDD